MIAGWDDGNHLEGYRSLTSALGLLEDIEFAGPLFGVEKEQAYAKASAFILPSYSEGLPMTVLEAWAFRLPVFKTAACNLPAGFQGGAAVKIDNSPESIAKQLAQFLPADALLASIGQKGRTLVEATYSWTNVAMMHRDLHHWLVNGGTAPAFVVHETEGKAVG
jgi:poly(glycerol-phosphate) alpha-glucosyltransferase